MTQQGIKRTPKWLLALALAVLVFMGVALTVYVIAPNDEAPVQAAGPAARPADLANILDPGEPPESVPEAPPEPQEKSKPPDAQAEKPPEEDQKAADEPPVRRPLAPSSQHAEPVSQDLAQAAPAAPPKVASKPPPELPAKVEAEAVSAGGVEGPGFRIVFESDEALQQLIDKGAVQLLLRREYPAPTYWLVISKGESMSFLDPDRTKPSVVEVPPSQLEKLTRNGLYKLRRADQVLTDKMVTLSPALSMKIADYLSNRNLSKERSVLVIKGNGDVEVLLARGAGT